MGEGFSIPRTGAVAPNFGIDTSRSKIRINLYFCKKKCHVERKGKNFTAPANIIIAQLNGRIHVIFFRMRLRSFCENSTVNIPRWRSHPI